MHKFLILAIISLSAVSVSIISVSAQNQYNIPSWVKGVAGYWAEGKITDSDFGEGLTFLINSNIIKVPQIQELQDKVNQLQSENANLRSQLNVPNLDDETTNIPPQPITVTVGTDKTFYYDGETILITGKVSKFLSAFPISLSLIGPNGDLITVEQTDVAPDNHYSATLPLGGPLMTASGTYTIQAQYGTASNLAQTTFTFTGSNLDTDVTASISATTELSMYENGDRILVNGKINNYDKIIDHSSKLSWIIRAPDNNFVSMGSVIPFSDGSFSFSNVAGGPLWKLNGYYTIEFHLGSLGKTIQIQYSGGTFEVPPPEQPACNSNQSLINGKCVDKQPEPPLASDEGVKSISLEKSIYTVEEQFSFVGTSVKGNKAVFVVIEDPFGDYAGMLSDPSSDADGSFLTISRDVTLFFKSSGIYTATAFTDGQKQAEGIQIKIKYDGNKITVY